MAGAGCERTRTGGQLRAQWHERLRRFDQRRGTVAAFCAAESISAWSLYDWRRKLAADEGSAGEAQVSTVAPFVEVGQMRPAQGGRGAAPGRLPGGGVELRLELGDGLLLTLVKR